MFTVTVIAFQLTNTELLDNSKLNQLGNPTISVNGTLRDLDDTATTAASDGMVLTYSGSTGLWTPLALPVSTSDTFNRIFAWANFS